MREGYQHEQADQQLKYIEEIIISAANLSIPVKADTCRRPQSHGGMKIAKML